MNSLNAPGQPMRAAGGLVSAAGELSNRIRRVDRVLGARLSSVIVDEADIERVVSSPGDDSPPVVDESRTTLPVASRFQRFLAAPEIALSFEGKQLAPGLPGRAAAERRPQPTVGRPPYPPSWFSNDRITIQMLSNTIIRSAWLERQIFLADSSTVFTHTLRIADVRQGLVWARKGSRGGTVQERQFIAKKRGALRRHHISQVLSIARRRRLPGYRAAEVTDFGDPRDEIPSRRG
jgi:hypothetical protein